MKSEQEVQAAFQVVNDQLGTAGLSDTQMVSLAGLLVALCWVLEVELDGEPNTIDLLLEGRSITPGISTTDTLKQLQAEANAKNN